MVLQKKKITVSIVWQSNFLLKIYFEKLVVLNLFK